MRTDDLLFSKHFSQLWFSIKTMTLSKSPALDPKPEKKSGRERFPFLQVQLQCELVRHAQNSSFPSFFGESKIGQSTQTSCTIALGQRKNALKAWGHFPLPNSQSFSHVWEQAETRGVCASLLSKPTSRWDGGHVSPDQHPAKSPLLLAALLLLLCQRFRVLKTGFISYNQSNCDECRISGIKCYDDHV